MMNKKILLISLALVPVLAVGTFFVFRSRGPELAEVKVESGKFRLTVSEGGTVEPENKISITAPIAGRIDQILFDEGAHVHQGQVIAWMSSTDRAALLDSAKVQGGEEAEDWADIYKPTPILAPTTGEIIARKIVVGQTVTQSTELYQLSDHLIVTADVDQTDLAKISMGQEADVTVDSFPNLVVKTKVMRIARQSLNKNSINTYEVLLWPEKLPKEFRAGLTASIYFFQSEKENATLLPAWVSEGREMVDMTLLVKKENARPEPRRVKIGMGNGEKVEVLSGLKPGETVLVKEQKILNDKSNGLIDMAGGNSGK